MKISIRLKFSIFFAALLLLTVFMLSILILNGIATYQKSQYEADLLREADTAALFVNQSRLTDSQLSPTVYLQTSGQRLALSLGKMLHHPVAVCSQEGVLLGSSAEGYENVDLKPLISTALDHKSAYMIIGDTAFFAAPLTAGDSQFGAVLLFYSLKANHEFNSHMVQIFIQAGALVLLISFVAGYVYFHRFSGGIRQLIRTAENIKSGIFENQLLKRNDELGELSGSLELMSGQIDSTIRDLKQEREKLSQAVEKLTRLEQQQKQFIGNVTHEFKTPLTSVGAYLDILEMYPEDAALRAEAYQNIKENTEKLRDMVDKVLYLSALEKYEFEMNPQKTDIKACLLKVCAGLKGKAERYGVRLVTTLEEAFVWADPESLSEIFVNLIDNAIKYNRENGSVIIHNDVSDNKVHITIADSGIGIQEAIREKIFQPFFMADKARSRLSGGTGLGLALVRQLVERLDGEISLTSEICKGSTFLLVFPWMQ